MKIAFFSTAHYDRHWFEHYQGNHRISFFDEALTEQTVEMAAGYQAVCAFVQDDLGERVLRTLKKQGVEIVAMRCAGKDNVDFKAAEALGITVFNVPAYSPYAVAEQAVALLLALNRHVPQAHNRIKVGNFSLDGLIGWNLHGKTVGVVGTGRIGRAFIQIMKGFGCSILAYDIKPKRNDESIQYVSLQTLLAESDVISLHCPLTPATERMINAEALAVVKPTAFLVNTSRGKVVDTQAVLDALDQGQLAGFVTDVYAEESKWFHQDFSGQMISDEVLNRLRAHDRVLLTAHQGFLTQEALQQIACTVLHHLTFYENTQGLSITKASMC